MREPLISTTFILDSDGTVLEAMGDAEVFSGGEARGRLLSSLDPDLGRMLKSLLDKAARGRGVENYALGYRLGRRMVALLASAVPYPLAALGKTGILLTLVSLEEKAPLDRKRPQERETPLPLPGMAEEREVSRKEDLAAVVDPLFILDREGNLSFANLSFQRLMGAGWEELCSSHLSSWMASPEPRQVVEQIIETVRLAPWRGELELRTREGREVLVNVTFSALPGGRGKPGGFLGCAKDFTELRRLWREKEGERARGASLLHDAPCGLLAFDAEGRVTLCNREAGRLLQTAGERAPGASLAEVLGAENWERVRELAGSQAAGPGRAEAVLAFPGRQGSRSLLRMRLAPLRADGGAAAEFVAAVEDVSGEEALRAAAAEAGLAMDFLGRCAARGARTAAGEEPAGVLLKEFADFCGASACAAYRVEEEHADLRASYGCSDDFAVHAGRLRIRPARMEALEALAGRVLGLGEGLSPDEAKGLRTFFRDWDDFRQANLDEGHDPLLFLPVKDGSAVEGVLVLGGVRAPQVDEGRLQALSRALPWLMPALRGPRSAEEGEPPAGPSAALDEEDVRRLAHELSTPLTYVRGFAQLLAEEADRLDPQALRELIVELDRGTALLTETVRRHLPQPPPDE